MNTRGSFFYPDRHLKIDNTLLEPAVVAERFVSHFHLAVGTGARLPDR